MAKKETFQCSVITPERVVLECGAKFAAFMAHDGEMGVMLDRAPLVCKLGIGTLRIDTGTEKHVLFIDGGFAQVVSNRLTVLTSQARKSTDIDRAAAEKALTEAKEMKGTDDASMTARSNAIRRAEVQIKVAR